MRKAAATLIKSRMDLTGAAVKYEESPTPENQALLTTSAVAYSRALKEYRSGKES